MYKILNPPKHGEVGLCIPSGNDKGEATYMLGVIVDESANVIKQTWKYIFEEWFKDSGYIFDETKLDFEYYDERCHKAIGTVMDIYVPVLKKCV